MLRDRFLRPAINRELREGGKRQASSSLFRGQDAGKEETAQTSAGTPDGQYSGKEEKAQASEGTPDGQDAGKEGKAQTFVGTPDGQYSGKEGKAQASEGMPDGQGAGKEEKAQTFVGTPDGQYSGKEGKAQASEETPDGQYSGKEGKAQASEGTPDGRDAGKEEKVRSSAGILRRRDAEKAGKVCVPDGMFRKCESCGKIIFEEDVESNWYCCPNCGRHFRIEPQKRLSMVVDKGSFEEWDAGLRGANPLDFPGYEEKLDRLRTQTGLDEAVVTGEASVHGIRTAIGVMSPDFMMGSMGTAVGEKITRMIERAADRGLPVLLFCCSGGARMQEGIFSLMQMAKTAQALRRLDEAGLPYVSILTDPTTGGVTASFAMLGDVILAEPGALIGFAGPRVIRQTIGKKLPEGFQSAEFLQKHGFVDRIVKRSRLRRTLAVILKSCEAGRAGNAAVGKKNALPGVKRYAGIGGAETGKLAVSAMEAAGIGTRETAAVEAERLCETTEEEAEAATGTREASAPEPKAAAGTCETAAPEPKGVAGTREASVPEPKGTAGTREASAPEPEAGAGTREASVPEPKGTAGMREAAAPNPVPVAVTAWDRVLAARGNRRPYAADYISHIFDGFLELRGDRLFGDDRAVIGGIASISGTFVTVIGQQKGRTVKENKSRNFGMPNPEGYRKALRLMKQAEKFGRPIILFVDTPGAFCGVEAEERGQGEAIARNLFEMAGLRVPVLTIVIGEGGSGGALAFAVSNEVWMLENAVYSVLSPEGFAAILWKDGKRAAEAAEVMKMTAAELKAGGIIEKIIPEPEPADYENMEPLSGVLKQEITEFLNRYRTKPPEEVTALRYEKFRRATC